MGEERDAPVFSLHNGGEQTTRLVLVLRSFRHSRIMGAYSERVLGPLHDPAATKAELAAVRTAQERGSLVDLEWATASGTDILCAYIDNDPPGRR
jgi:hypothetical protein